MRRIPTLLPLLLALAVPASAAAQEANPLTGMRLVGNLPLDRTDVAASDLELHGDFAYIGSYSEGLVIADVSDPAKPRRVGTFRCGGGSQYDVQLSDDASIVLLTTDSSGASCLPDGRQGSMVIDARDKANPRLASFIPIAAGSHTHTLDGTTLYVNNYPTSYSRLEVFDLADPAAPRKVGQVGFGGEDSIHDSSVDHRPDGRTLLYAASIGFTDVLDVTDRTRPRILQRLADPEVSISHQAEPNAARDVLAVTDEFAGGQDVPACGKGAVSLPDIGLPVTGDPLDTGALHFYRLAPDGTLAGEKLGTFNLPAAGNPSGGCTVHVFTMAPDQNRLVTAWYGRGIHVVDFQDPSAARALASFTPTGANVWAAKTHRVGGRSYVFTGDINRGMDVLEFTADGGWPATAGAAEADRRARRGLPPAPGAPGAAPRPAAPTATPSRPARPIDQGVRFARRVRVPGPKGRKTVTLTLTDRRGRVATKLRFRLPAGRRVLLRARIAGLRVGTYRYAIRLGDRGRVLQRGRVRILRDTRRARAAGVGGGTAAGGGLVCVVLR